MGILEISGGWGGGRANGGGSWALGYNSMKFWDLPDRSYFPKILSFKLFGMLWGNSYISCLLLMIAFH